MSIKDFQILNKLGEGSFSSVWKVKRISDGQEYAMKKVKIAALSEKERQNALNEVRILASLKSSFIVGYKEAFLEDNSMTLCIVMEYAGGGDLFNKIVKHQKSNTLFKEQDIWRFAIQMIMGLKVLHDMKILHRDLKCANVFLSTDEKIAKLGDLNVSKVTENNLARTQTGTPYYASPEVWRDQPYDAKSDIWSVGCVIYEMCALKPPFRANDMQGLYKKIQRGVFDRIPSNYSIDLYNLISMCLQIKPAQRPSCDQLLNHPIFQKHGGELLNDIEFFEGGNELLGTIKLPKNIRSIGQQLPKPNYEDEVHPLPVEIPQVAPSSVKNQAALNLKRPISQNVAAARPILVRESQSRESRITHMQKVEHVNMPAAAKKESEKEYLARMQKEYIDKAKAIRPLDLLKEKSPRAVDHLVRQKSPIYAMQGKKVIENIRPKEEVPIYKPDPIKIYNVYGNRPVSSIVEVRRAAEEVLLKNEALGLQQKANSRAQSRGDPLGNRELSERQEYLINKYQRADPKRGLGKVQSEKDDLLLRKADYLINKYQSPESYRKEQIASRDDGRRPGGTPSYGNRNHPQDILDRYRNNYNVNPVIVRNQPNETPQKNAPVRKVDYQYLVNNNLLKKSPVNANGNNISVVKQHMPIKVAVKPQWWG